MSRTAFMIMPFSDSVAESIYAHSTKPICENEFKLEVRRANEIFSTNPVWDDIVMAVEQARVVVVDISGKNPNVFYELGMSHMLKKSSTVMITHDEYGDLPFDIAHFRVIQYQDSIEGKAKYESELRLTLRAVLENVKETYKEEFDLVRKLLTCSNKGSELLYLIGISKAQKPLRVEDPIAVEGRSSTGSHMASIQSATSGLQAFLATQYLEVVGDMIVLSDKGKGFVEYLEQQGYEVHRFNKEIFTDNYVPFYERVAKRKQDPEADRRDGSGD